MGDAVEAALLFNLVGDRASAGALKLATRDIRTHAADESSTSDLSLFLAHIDFILKTQPRADLLLRQIVSGSEAPEVDRVQELDQRQFSDRVAIASRYRGYLYVWSIILLALVVLGGVQLTKLYRSLEQRVQSRTAELKKAMSELWGEMHLAQKIQESLVPDAPTFAHAQLSARMVPAEEVGGDYYDVISSGGSEWLVIGDVSGHGVPAGLVMMMCQTAVRTLIGREPGLGPDQLLSGVNEVLVHNLERLGEDKYMTAVALKFAPNGVVQHAGAHQELFVYRSESGTVDVIRTSGPWLGIMGGMEDKFEVGEFSLGLNDVLVAFTDGITEATRDELMLDNEGLAELLRDNCASPPAAVIDAVFSELSGYQTDDDATMVVVQWTADGPLGVSGARRGASAPA